MHLFQTGESRLLILRTAIVNENYMNMSFCQISKTSSTSITYHILKSLAVHQPKIHQMMRECEEAGDSYCNYHKILRMDTGLGYGLSVKTPTKVVKSKIEGSKLRVIFVRHPLEKFFAGARAQYHGEILLQWTPLIVATSGPALSVHNNQWLLCSAVFCVKVDFGA